MSQNDEDRDRNIVNTKMERREKTGLEEECIKLAINSGIRILGRLYCYRIAAERREIAKIKSSLTDPFT